MAQTPQSEETGGAGETTAPGAGRPPGLFGSSTTILLLILAVAVFWWNRRRRVETEERLRAQRREAEEAAERSALDVAHLMRTGLQRGTVAADEGLAAAAHEPSYRVTQPPAGATPDPQTTTQKIEAELGQPAVAGGRQDVQALEIERAQARAVADRAAEEQAQRASRDAEMAGESAVRRAAAATAAAEEAEADTTDAQRAGQTAAVPAGAIAGNGTVNCPSNYPIKGNRQSRIYHNPGQVSYPTTIAEFCFASAEAAEQAGFRVSRARDQRLQQ
jgi:hypothetical protein